MDDTTIRMKGVVRASQCVSTRVVSETGEPLGKVEDVVLDLRECCVVAVAISFAGFLGLGEKLFVVPLSVMSFDSMGRQFVLHVDREALENAPGFDREEWPDLNDRRWAEEIYSYYGYPPYWE
jgi:sporulation protein YlmC with PRC-barrel domain